MENVSLFSKGAQNFSYRWIIMSPRRSLGDILWFVFLYSQKELSISHIDGYFFFILKRCPVFLISLGNFSLFAKGAQYFSYRWIIFPFILKRRSVFLIYCWLIWFMSCGIFLIHLSGETVIYYLFRNISNCWTGYTIFGLVQFTLFMSRVNWPKPGYASITCSTISNIPYNLMFPRF